MMRFLLVSVLVWHMIACSAQVSVKDSVVRIPMLSVSYAYQIPGGDLAKRFGHNSNLGGSFLYKNRRNLIYGFEGAFLFGNDLKESGILDSISTRRVVQGLIIDNSGIPADIRLYERGFSLSLVAGKIFSIKRLSPNKNSGITILVKAGYLQHKIRIEDINHSAVQVGGDYRKGYDRLTSGYAIHELIGYTYFGNRRLINFFAGFEFMQAFTRSQRYDFDLMRHDPSQRNDFLSGFRVGWIIPLYKKAPNEFYYF
jgi:hypothetical protein